MGCLRTIVYIGIIWMIFMTLYQLGYKKTTDADYDIGIPEPVPTKEIFDSSLLKKPDNKPYKGNWVDVE